MGKDEALVRDPQVRRDELSTFLFERKSLFSQIAAEHMHSERLIRMALANATRNPQLLQCTNKSWALALLDSVFYGVEPNPQLGHAYLVPYENRKAGCKEVQFMLGYKGIILLATNTGSVYDIDAEVVYENDTFQEVRHQNPPYIHEPEPNEEVRGKIVGVYAVGWRNEPQRPKFKYLSLAEVEKYRRRSKAAQSGPWVTDWEAMAKKTAIRRMATTLPIQPGSKLGVGISQEQLREEGVFTYTHDVQNDKLKANDELQDIDLTV